MTISVALVDDQILFRKGLKALLESFGGIKVEFEADNVKKLIAQLSKSLKEPNICIVSSQAYMRNKSGTLRGIKQRFEGMKILVLSGCLHEYTIQILRKEWINGFLLKSASPGELRKAVFTMHTTGTYWPNFPESILASVEKKAYSTYTTLESHLQFLELCREDINYMEMGKNLGVSVRTIEGYRDALFRKFKVSNRTSLVMFAIKNGLIELK